MKTLGRIFIILAAFALVMGISYVAVNAGASSLDGTPRIEIGERPFPPNGQFQPGQRLPGGDFEGRREEDGERGFGLMGLMFGFIKNTVIIAVFVALISVPRSLMRNKKRPVPAETE